MPRVRIPNGVLYYSNAYALRGRAKIKNRRPRSLRSR
jgi:hypothetical protein